ncbi:PspC domain-containing protein [Hoyosella subflava]|uniref:PspC domain protein n=1 Tax=Hoyosella subflava (strain DSM 45089 / JCM 17490 / NBRC 109087 / DQS3-9A1) TaxID=443218 RepID=F6EIG4_HOYSD|nr:PspC domain-containing protein [Hoyosella subflava]AEF42456.1 PspC domain protein [Hoyosella subflava DQS3-9A1]
MTTTSFSDQVNDLWRTRPARLSHTGKIAGVCSGFGHRYQVDPVLVRVAFIVSAFFGGAGIVLYLAGWLLLPKDADQTSSGESLIGRGSSSQSQPSTVVLVVALAIAVSIFAPVGLGAGGSGLVSLALMLVGWWLLYQRQPTPPPLPGYVTAWTPPTVPPHTWGQPSPGAWTAPHQTAEPHTTPPSPHASTPEQTSAPRAAQPAATSGSDATAHTERMAQTPPVTPSAMTTRPAGTGVHEAATTRHQPPSWDPLGVAPFAWDLPEPAPAHLPVVVKPRSRLTAVTLGLAIILAAVLTALALTAGTTWLTPGRIGAATLAVVGAGLLVGAFRGVGHGLVPVAAPLAGFVIIATIAAPIDFSYFQAGVGERTYQPATVSDLQPEYRLGLGSLTLDLRDLDLTESATIDASVGMGELIVHVPDDINVRTSCAVQMGEMACPNQGLSLGAGTEDAPELTVSASVTTGKVEILHG